MSKPYDDDKFSNISRVFAIKDAEHLLEGRIRRRFQAEAMESPCKGDFLFSLTKCRTHEVEPLPLHIAPGQHCVQQLHPQAHKLALQQAQLRTRRKVSAVFLGPTTRQHAPVNAASLTESTRKLEEAEHIKRRKKKGK
jgi:hypothetical protein